MSMHYQNTFEQMNQQRIYYESINWSFQNKVMSTIKRGESSQAVDNAMNESLMEGGEYAEFANGLNVLTGAQILEIFTKEQNFLQLCKISFNFPETMNRFCWRLKSIIGQIFLEIQKQLSLNDLLQHSITLDHLDVHELAAKILEEGKTIKQNHEFQNFKKGLEASFNSGFCDQNSLISMYGICMKLWKPPLRFYMDFSSYAKNKPSIDQKQDPVQENSYVNVNPHPNPRMGPFSVLRMPPNQRALYQQRKASEEQPRRKTSQEDDTINLNDGKDDMRPAKCLNRNWTLPQEESFCRFYIENDNPQFIKGQMERKHGVDARWSSVKQVPSKMQALTAKIFKKFSSLETTNANIIKFRTLKSFVLSSDRINDKQRISLFKLFAAIYEAMLNVNQSKKALISQKILEVIHFCERIQKE